MSFHSNSALHDDLPQSYQKERPASGLNRAGGKEKSSLTDRRFAHYGSELRPHSKLIRLASLDHKCSSVVEEESPGLRGQVLAPKNKIAGDTTGLKNDRHSLLTGLSHYYNNLFMALWGIRIFDPDLLKVRFPGLWLGDAN